MKSIFHLGLVALMLHPAYAAEPSQRSTAPADPSSIQPTSAQIGAVRSLLNGFCGVPSPAARQRVAGPDVMSAALMQLAASPAERLHVRARAVSLLHAYPRPEVRAFLLERLQSEAQQPILQRKALQSLAMAFPADAESEASARLQHPDIAMREAAVRALEQVATPLAKKALLDALQRETTATVRTRIQFAIKHFSTLPAAAAHDTAGAPAQPQSATQGSASTRPRLLPRIEHRVP